MIDAPGIYQITHKDSGRRYVGQAKNIKRRWREHTRSLENGRHTSSYLQRAWDKYGAGSFAFSVIEICQIEALDEREQLQLDQGADFNVLKFARSPLGVKRSQETKDRISRALKGKPKSVAHRASLAKAGMGKVQTLESRTKKSEAAKGRPHSTEHRAKLTAANKARTGYRHTPETIEKMRAGRKA